MDTSGQSTLSIVAALVVLVAFLQIGVRLLALPTSRRGAPVLALVVTIAIGVPSLLQLVWPSVGEALRRDPAATLERGEWWRVLTALLAQDGGVLAVVFGLVVVAVATGISERIWGRPLALALFLVPSIAVNLLAVLVWRAPGGGSSFASDGLMASVAALGLLTGERLASPWRVIVPVLSGVVILAGVVLVFAGDAHGVAVLIGAALGLIAAPVRMRRRA